MMKSIEDAAADEENERMKNQNRFFSCVCACLPPPPAPTPSCQPICVPFNVRVIIMIIAVSYEFQLLSPTTVSLEKATPARPLRTLTVQKKMRQNNQPTNQLGLLYFPFSSPPSVHWSLVSSNPFLNPQFSLWDRLCHCVLLYFVSSLLGSLFPFAHLYRQHQQQQQTKKNKKNTHLYNNNSKKNWKKIFIIWY